MRAPFVVVAALLTEAAHAQGVTVSGTVRDSIAGGTLAGALVQLVADSANATPRNVVADSAGRYRVDGVARGRYVISFLHPLLDSLTLEPILHSLDITGARDVAYDLATPSGARLRVAFCGARGSAAFVGVVRDAISLEPIAGASVVAEWFDMVISRGGMTRQPARRAATSAANGWFTLCDVPGPGNFSLHARRGADSTDILDFSVPGSLFARRDLYVGAPAARGRASGHVANEKGAPLAGAIVRLAGASTRVGADGDWALSNLPAGTHVLEVRAIGYYPDRRPVDVLAEPSFVRVQMSTFEAVLDTMRVRAPGLAGADQGGFEERRRKLGNGRFLTEEDIRRRAPIEVSDVFKSVPGLYVEDNIRMRGGFSAAGSGTLGECVPFFFLDGRPMPAPRDLFELDSWVKPTTVASIEIYTTAPPPQFEVPMGGCGSIVIWTKRGVPARKPPR